MSPDARLIPVAGFLIASLLALAGARYASEAARAEAHLGGLVYWSDGASGRLSDGTRFRLDGIEVPATGPVHERTGARCEAERQLGFEARRIAAQITRGHEVVVTEISGRDAFGRNIVSLSLAGEDVAGLLISSGLHRSSPGPGEGAAGWCGPASG